MKQISSGTQSDLSAKCFLSGSMSTPALWIIHSLSDSGMGCELAPQREEANSLHSLSTLG